MDGLAKFKTAFIINSRVNSNRVPNKAFIEFKWGKRMISVIEALTLRLLSTGIPVIIAVPKESLSKYKFLTKIEGVYLFGGDKNDPLKRMSDAASKFEVENVIRVCHDKIFVDPDLVLRGLRIFTDMNTDYLYSSWFIDGTGFEIIKASTVHFAASIYKKIEDISYAIKAITKNTYCWPVPMNNRSENRMLIDYPEDLAVIKSIFQRFKTKTVGVKVSRIMDFLNIHPEICKLNQLPPLTVYTCCYNMEKYIASTINSVIAQSEFWDSEYILVDDCSTDNSAKIMQEYADKYINIKLIKNKKNLGLASSSNIALENALGRYIVRIDADDTFVKTNALKLLLNSIRFSKDKEAIYSAKHFGKMDVIEQPGGDVHHIGGTIFNLRAINNIKFTDGLRGYEGLDFFHRAKDLLSIGYLNDPIYFYRQHGESLSKNNLKERNKIKNNILAGEA